MENFIQPENEKERNPAVRIESVTSITRGKDSAFADSTGESKTTYLIYFGGIDAFWRFEEEEIRESEYSRLLAL